METADSENKPIIMLGDMNLCTTKQNEPDFKSKHIAEEMKSSLAQCGMINIELGHTYQADRLSEKSIAKQWKLKFNITFKSLLSKHITQL